MPDERLAGLRPGRDTTGQATRPVAPSPVWRPFCSPERLAEVPSTNLALAERAKEGAPEGTVLLAESQSAGRGRLGRRWLDPPGGSILCSLLFRPRLPLEEWFLAPMAVSLAARAACEQVAGAETACKWPNDLVSLPDGLKLAGVLAETVGETPGSAPRALVVGIGLNCNWPADFPPAGLEGDELATRATSLDRLTGRPVDKSALEAALLSEVARRWHPLAEAGLAPGKAALLSEFRAACATLGQQVRVELPTGAVEGEALAIEEDGRLRVATEVGEATFGVGDVVHLRPKGAPPGR